MARSHRRAPSPPTVGIPIVGRRTLLKGLAGAAGLTTLAACGGGGDEGGSASKTVTFGSNYSDQVPRESLAKVIDGFQKSSGITVKVNTVDHNTFQEQINNYLQGKPDDVFSWFAGYRMQFFAERGLATPITDVWDKIAGGYTDAFKQASTGLDGEQYIVPFDYYPWAVFYRKSVFQERGYQPARTLDEFKALCQQMQSDGLVPLAFADKDGWPAMGTFDYLNMRINGYQFHIDLMAGKEAWDSAEVKEVFTTWRELLPYHQEGALGRTWQEAGQSLLQKKSGMYLLGMFVGEQFPEAEREDLDFFAFPEISPEHGQKAVEAPIDGFMLSKDPDNEEGSKQLLEYLGGVEAQNTYLAADPNNAAAHSEADTSAYSPLQQKAVELVSAAENISQFLDRDTRPDFASTVMIPSLQAFLNKPDDVDGLTKQIEQQKQSIFSN
jgi:multiple sugar transport system substrate-binding protein